MKTKKDRKFIIILFVTGIIVAMLEILFLQKSTGRDIDWFSSILISLVVVIPITIIADRFRRIENVK